MGVKLIGSRILAPEQQTGYEWQHKLEPKSGEHPDNERSFAPLSKAFWFRGQKYVFYHAGAIIISLCFHNSIETFGAQETQC